MYHPQESSILSILICIFQLLAGAVLLFIFGLCTIVAATDLAEYGTTFLCICVVLDVIGILFLRAGIRRVRAIRAAKRRAAQEASSITNFSDFTDFTNIADTALAAAVSAATTAVADAAADAILSAATDINHKEDPSFKKTKTATEKNGIISQTQFGSDENGVRITIRAESENIPTVQFSMFQSGDTAEEKELVTVECPNCGNHMNIPKGEQKECPYCRTILKGE